jgi:hypothetical protein
VGMRIMDVPIAVEPRALSAEQLSSHILPSLAGIGPLSVRVEPDKQKKDNVA